MNKVFLTGNLTRDPELLQTSSGTSVCHFTIAVNRQTSNGRETDFYDVTAWRNLADTIAKNVRKGNKVAVYGDIELRKYTDRFGASRIGVDVVAYDVEFMTPRTQTEDAPAERRVDTIPYDPTGGDFDESDIPF